MTQVSWAKLFDFTYLIRSLIMSNVFKLVSKQLLKRNVEKCRKPKSFIFLYNFFLLVQNTYFKVTVHTNTHNLF